VLIVGAAPSWTDLTSAICAIVAVVIGLPGLAAALSQLSTTRRAALAQLAITLGAYIQRWDSPDMRDARAKTARLRPDDLRDTVVGAYTRGAADEALTYLRVPNYFEELGSAVRQGALPQSALPAALWLATTSAWNQWQSTVAALQERFDDTSVYANFERLAQEAVTHRSSR
jgi:hypothetical protein